MACCRRRRSWAMAAFAVTGLALTGLGASLFRESNPPPIAETPDRPPEITPESGTPGAAGIVDDDRLRAQAVGTWVDDYQGKRTMTLRDDGTGTMVVELSGAKARLVAPRLTFDMEWSIDKGRMTKRTLRGEPAAQVRMILAAMGDRVEERILELTEDRLLLLDPGGRTQYDWRRAGNLSSTEAGR